MNKPLNRTISIDQIRHEAWELCIYIIISGLSPTAEYWKQSERNLSFGDDFSSSPTILGDTRRSIARLKQIINHQVIFFWKPYPMFIESLCLIPQNIKCVGILILWSFIFLQSANIPEFLNKTLSYLYFIQHF